MINSYKLPDSVDKNKIFLVNYSDIDSRWDSDFYKAVYCRNSELITSNQFCKLKNICSFSLENWDQKSIFDSLFPYIEISEINLSSGKIAEIKSLKVIEAPSRARKIVRNQDIIISTTRPTRGAIALVENDDQIYIASTGFSVIRQINLDKISRKYLFHVLRSSFCLLQMGQRSSGGNYPAITQEELGNIIIPLPSIDMQKKIVKMYEDAYQKKQQRELEAKELLASIDSYLLNALDIEIQPRDNSLHSRVFTTDFTNIVGERFDPVYYNSNLLIFNSGRYKSIDLSSIAYSLKSGTGAGKQDQTSAEHGVIQIRPTNIGEYGELKFDKNIYLPLRNSWSNDSFVIKGDVLFNNTNSQELVGKSSILESNQELLFSNHITRIRVNSELCNSYYLCQVLNLYQKNMIFYSICTNWNNQSGIGLNLLKSLNIPLPPLTKADANAGEISQEEIVAHISAIRAKAKQLQEEANKEIEAAKNQIEQIILHGDIQ